MKITLLQTGKTTVKYVSDGVEDFCTRLKRYTNFEIVTLPDLKNTKKMPLSEQKIREGTRIVSSLNSEDYVILLDERGEEYNTFEFAGFLEKMFLLTKRRVVFVIGGPFGFSDEVYERADRKLALSRLTFSHQLVRLLFMEQLYRAFTVIKGDPYHHD